MLPLLLVDHVACKVLGKVHVPPANVIATSIHQNPDNVDVIIRYDCPNNSDVRER